MVFHFMPTKSKISHQMNSENFIWSNHAKKIYILYDANVCCFYRDYLCCINKSLRNKSKMYSSLADGLLFIFYSPRHAFLKTKIIFLLKNLLENNILCKTKNKMLFL